MDIIEIYVSGKKKKRSITRKHLAEELDLHIRDLRPVFSLRQRATIMSRGTVIIVNLGIIKSIITPEKIIVANLSEPIITDTFIPHLLETLKKKEEDGPFEGWILDYAVHSKVARFAMEVEILETKVQKLLKKLNTSQDETNLERLLLRKKELSKLEINLRENLDAAEDVLADDEELKELCITQIDKGIKLEKVEAEEIESIFDSFVEQVEVLLHRIEEVKENIDDTQEIISLKLGTRRNVIIRFDLVATLVTAFFSLMAVVTGLYGMNIRNSLESHDFAFWVILLGLVLSLIVFLVIMWRQLKKLNIF